MNARCPECGGGLGELLEKRDNGGNVTADFECANCGYEWSVLL